MKGVRHAARRGFRARGALLAASLAFAALAPPAAGASGDGTGASAWGPIAAPDSANTAAYAGRGQPTWEKVVNFPYNVAFLPLKLTFAGLEAGVEAFDESPTLRRLVHLLPIVAGPAVVSGGVSAGTGDGFGANVSLDVRDFGARHHALKLRLAGETRGERRSTFALRLRRTEASWFDFAGGYRSDHNSVFHGIGPDSPEDAESFYRRETTWGGATWHRRFADGDFGWSLSGIYNSIGTSGTEHSDEPHLSEEFADELPFGYRFRSEGWMARLILLHENTVALGGPLRNWRERGRPDRGGLRRASISWFEGKGAPKVQYWSWRVEAQQFVNLPLSRRALALRGVITRIENEGEAPVPFQRMITNDDPDLLRGYPDERFYDLGLLALTAEYRWPIWALKTENSLGVDAYLFTDYGQVFSEFEQIDTDRMTFSWGGGMRLVGDGNFHGRLEIGRSDEGTTFRLRADQVFQFEKGGLFFGRPPQPDR